MIIEIIIIHFILVHTLVTKTSMDLESIFILYDFIVAILHCLWPFLCIATAYKHFYNERKIILGCNLFTLGSLVIIGQHLEWLGNVKPFVVTTVFELWLVYFR